ncbi:phosphatase PAP2 family protein [Micromonospora sp. KC723]|uniref:phosphatase PAP2 family protein n=1 Tax=Micromonospora sp. KC723 TaxID=2530381 RepID=UPI0014055A2C|nr:phosphatase PAP2 family protein [Micromonospora sp. KC723]
MAGRVATMGVTGLNYHLFAVVNGWAGSHGLVDDVFEWAATWLIFVMAALTVVPGRALVRSGAWTVPLRVGASLALALGIGQVVGRLAHEPRPFQTHVVHQLIPHAADASLPSDHATVAFALAFAIWVFLSRPWGIALTVLATVIGFARVWVGVHYPGDIAAGALIGAAAVTLVVAGERLMRRARESRRPASP